MKSLRMKKKKKFTTAELIVLVFCSLGISLLVASKFIESEYNLSSIALALNGIGIVALLFRKK